MASQSATFGSNPLLKRPNVSVSFTQWQLDEWDKCAEDAEYFAEKYIKIVNVDRGLINFDMYAYQRKMIKTFQANRFVITKMPRQSGKSTTVTSYMLWKILFQDNQNCCILANKGRLANDLLDKIKTAYENLPLWIQQGVVVWNRGSIELENGSKVMAAATSSSSVRGGSYNLILLDEFAFVQSNLAENFFASVYPTISSGEKTQVIIVSTPFGMNHYHKMWIDASEGRSDYVPLEVLWTETPGRDEEFKRQTIRNTSQQQWDQEFGCEFLGSSDTLISGVKLRQLVHKPYTSDPWKLDVHVEPIKGHNYVICADTSHGVGQDYSAFTVIDTTEVPYVLAAKFYDNQTSPMMFPEVIVRAAIKYNNAFVLGEINDVGQAVVDAIYRELEYENVITTVTKGRAGQRISGGFGGTGGTGRTTFGVKMTTQVKKIGCSNIKDLIECDKLILGDHEIHEELARFVKKLNTYQAVEGFHDDLVMTLVLFGWLARQQYFKDLTNTDVRNQMAQDKYQEVWDDLLPAGIVDYGSDVVDLGTELRSLNDDDWL